MNRLTLFPKEKIVTWIYLYNETINNNSMRLDHIVMDYFRILNDMWSTYFQKREHYQEVYDSNRFYDFVMGLLNENEKMAIVKSKPFIDLVKVEPSIESNQKEKRTDKSEPAYHHIH